MELMRRFGVSHNTACILKQKLMQVMFEREAGTMLNERALFCTLYQQVFHNSKLTACGLIYRFDTDIGSMWEDNYGRRFLATVGQLAWSTNTG